MVQLKHWLPNHLVPVTICKSQIDTELKCGKNVAKYITEADLFVHV